jgi:DNA modification methylase
MIFDGELNELKTYRSLEKGVSLELKPNWATLVVSAENDNLPIHRWFRFKESFSAELLPTLLELAPNSTREQAILDPYCGVGTTLLAAQTLDSHKIRATGIEYNPFIRFVAKTKLQWHLVNPDRLERIASKVVSVEPATSADIPALSGLRSGRCMSKYVARRLLSIRDAIKADGVSATSQALLLGLAASIEQLSLTRKDGRALRLVDRERQVVSKVLNAKWKMIANDIRCERNLRRHLNTVGVIPGDGLAPLQYGIEPNSIDLIVTSPPYPNNIDYSEVYKLELWIMGFIANSESFLQLRKGTFRSHPTSKLSSPEDRFERKISTGRLHLAFEPILSKLDTEQEKWRRKLFIAYFSDTDAALRQYRKVLKPNGRAFIAVGNSLHGGKYSPYLIATDLLIAELARSHGFVVDRISIVRSLKRRLSGNHFLRESIISLRKANA